MGPIRKPNWSTSGMRIMLSYLYKLNFEVIIYTFSMHRTLTGRENSVVQGSDYNFAHTVLVIGLYELLDSTT
jgi:hypothetical protein